MRVSVLRKRLAVAALGAMLVNLHAQTDQSGTMFAPIMRTERAGGGVVRVVYDLRGVSGTAFAVSLEASDDGGQTFSVRARALTGDVGPRVSPGAEKTIVWDSTKDVDDLQVDRYVFRVRVSAAGPSAAVASPAAAATPPSGRGASGAGSGAAAPKKGGLGKGALIAILGGGAAAGIGVAVAGGKSGATPSTPSTASPSTATPQTPPFNLNGTWVRTFIFSDPPVSGSMATLTFALTQTGTTVSGNVTITLGPPAGGTDIRPISGTVATSSPRITFDNPIRSNPFTDRFGRPYGLCTEHYFVDPSTDGNRLSGTVTQTPDALCPTVNSSASVTLTRQ
jgi:hypothetical protein